VFLHTGNATEPLTSHVLYLQSLAKLAAKGQKKRTRGWGSRCSRQPLPNIARDGGRWLVNGSPQRSWSTMHSEARTSSRLICRVVGGSSQHDAPPSTACARFNGDTANGPGAIYERERFLLSYVAIPDPHWFRHANIWGFCGRGCRRRARIGSVLLSSRLLFCLWDHHAGRTWSHERVSYRDSAGSAPLPATATTGVMQVDSDSPRRQTFQTIPCGTTCHSSRGQNAQPVLFLSGHSGFVPCPLPKRPPSRHGKVASNLDSAFRLCSALVCPGSLTRRASSSVQSRFGRIAIGSLKQSCWSLLNPTNSHSRHPSMYLSLPTAPQLVVHAGWDVH